MDEKVTDDGAPDGLPEPGSGALEPPVGKAEAVLLTWAARLCTFLLVVVALGYMATYVVLAYYRIPYPFDLEWLEGGMAQEVQRVLDGEKLYVEPSLDYVPAIYTPLYFYLCALVCSGSGVTFAALRLVSFLASLGCFAVIFQHVRRETRSAIAGLISAGLYAATFRIAGAWFDIARVDSLFLFFLLAGLYLARFKTSLGGHLLTGVVLSLAFLTKQSALLVMLPLLAAAVVVNWRRALVLIGTVALILGGTTVLLDYLHDGWYVGYLFGQPASDALVSKMWLGFWTKDMASKTSLAGVMALFGLFIQLAKPSKKPFLFYGAVSVGMVCVSWASRLHFGGYDNVLMPVYAWMAILSGIALGTVLRFARRCGVRTQRALEIALCPLFLVQFALLLYEPGRQVPTPADLEAGRTLVRLCKETEGDIFIPYHNYLPALAGKRIYAGKMGINGILQNRESPYKARLTKEIQDAIREKRFGLIVMNTSRFFARDINRHYQGVPPMLKGGVFYPVTGMRTHPTYFYVPKTRRAGPSGTQGHASPKM